MSQQLFDSTLFTRFPFVIIGLYIRTFIMQVQYTQNFKFKASLCTVFRNSTHETVKTFLKPYSDSFTPFDFLLIHISKHYSQRLNSLKFIYYEKATKFCKIFTLLLTGITQDKSKVKISQNIVAFSEYMNFIKPFLITNLDVLCGY